ncbi:MAG TPA: ADP-ribosylation factor-like protein [Candidatus Deferrimicrobium sp.]|nr:ADP-ribosylation factor-like protein [Candidatus Deferrimicrobium sp.]
MTIKFKIVVIGGAEEKQEILLLDEKNLKEGENYETEIGLDFKLKYKIIEETDVNLVLWLIRGEKFKEIKRNFYEGADGIVLLFDASQEENIEKIISKIQQIREKSPNSSILLISRNIRNQINEIIEKYTKKLIEKGKPKESLHLNIDFFDALEKNGLDPEEFLDFLTKKLLSRVKY